MLLYASLHGEDVNAGEDANAGEDEHEFYATLPEEGLTTEEQNCLSHLLRKQQNTQNTAAGS